jgi:hypothetical protein
LIKDQQHQWLSNGGVDIMWKLPKIAVVASVAKMY